MKKILLVFLCLSPLLLFCQKINLTGTIKDYSDSSALPQASVKLISMQDSTAFRLVVTNEDGFYKITDIDPGQYLYKITFIGYETFSRQIELGINKNSVIDIYLKSAGILLNGVNINGKTPTINIKGDTSEMKASSYKVNEDASAEDLLKKMPGIQIQDGKLNAQGEEVKRVLVDGKVFFGSDPKAAVKNIPAEMIDKIQVFDRSSDLSQFTGIDDGNQEKTINLITKADRREGKFGRIQAGLGTNEHYKATGIINFFDKKKKLTLLAMTNNINEVNFTNDDLNSGQNTSSGGGGGGRFRRGGGNPFNSNNTTGLNQTSAIGANYFFNPTEKLELSTSLFGSYSDVLTIQNITRNYTAEILKDWQYFENNEFKSNGYKANFNARLQYKLDSTKTIIYSPSANIGLNHFNGMSNSITSIILSRSTQNSTVEKNKTNQFSISNSLIWMQRLKKVGQSYAIELSQSYGNSSPELLQNQQNLIMDSVDIETNINQLIFNQSFDQSYSARIEYTHPIFKNNQFIIASYESRISLNSIDKKNYIGNEELENNLNIELSNETASKYITHKPKVSYRFQNIKTQFNGGITWQSAELRNNQHFPINLSTSRIFYNFLPELGITQKIGVKSSIRLRYNTNTQQPTVRQLQEVIDNSNLLSIYSGNKDLKQSYSHNIFSRIQLFNSKKFTNLFIGGGFTYTTDYIGNQIIIANQDTSILQIGILNKGTQFTTTNNFKNNFSSRGFLNYGFPFSLLKSNINLNAFGRYSNTPSGINQSINQTKTLNYGGGIVVASNFSSEIDFSINSTYNFGNVKNSISKSNNGNSLQMINTASCNITFVKKIVFSTDFSLITNQGISSVNKENFSLWNAAIAYKFLEKNKGEIRLSAFDLLKNNTAINREYTDTYFNDITSNILTRYFMLSFQYKF